MTKGIEASQITTAAQALADCVLTSTQYHVKATSCRIQYRTYYLTVGQESDLAFAVDNFLRGKSATLEVRGITRPDGYKASTAAWTITREIASRATRILRDANRDELKEAEVKSLHAKANRPPHHRSIAARN